MDFRQLRNSPLYFARVLGLDLKNFPYISRVFEDNAEIVYLRWGRGMGKTTTVMNIVLHSLVTRQGFKVIGSAPRDWQAWRLTKEFIRPLLRRSFLKPLIDLAEIDRVTEIVLPNNSHWMAKGSWATGDSLRGPHVNLGIADEIQDWTEEAWTVLLEVVSLPPKRIYAMGTGCQAGTLSEELWEASDKKEWNGREWVPQNEDWDGRVSGYHITQEYSPFVSKEELEWKRKNYTERMWITEVLADFWRGDVKPIPLGKLLPLVRERIPEFERVSIGIDWGNETRWVVVAQSKKCFIVLDSGVWDDLEISLQVKKAVKLILTWKPSWVMCDLGFGRSQIQELSRQFPGLIWGVGSNKKSALYPEFTVTKDLKGRRIPKQDWVYSVSIDHTSMCEFTESLIAKGNLLFSKGIRGLDSLLYEITEAEIVFRNEERRWNITRAHGFAAISYALLPFMLNQSQKFKPAAI